MKKNILLLTTLFLFMFPNVLQADEMVTVKLVNYVGEATELEFKLNREFFSFDPTLQLQEGVTYTLSVQKGSLYLQENNKREKQKLNGPFILIPEKYNEEHQIYIDDRPYLGAMEFTIEKDEFIRPVNQLPLEDYLKGVVPFEVFSSWGIETLKAQTLAARTYAVSKLNEVINDTIQYQVYGGYTWDDSTTKAVEETKGEVITYENRLIETFYSASNGGVTENNANVWGGNSMQYFPVKDDPYDPTHPWDFTLNQTQIELEKIEWDKFNWWDELEEKDTDITETMKGWLQRNGYPGDIKILSIPSFELSDDTFESGRSENGSITVEFMQRLFEGTVLFRRMELKDINLNQIRPMIGGTIFKSYLIDSLEADDEQYTMKGRGYGHGVGMSQWGAHYMAENGKDYKEILAYYYPGTTIMDLANDAIVLPK
ncbi:SpoIID/LytB domain-containing protein [Ornithinibacillus sp. L9]|uniref:SpoIID/LytB domain-containing protein n=2 Tax=Ornithinibacillus caprae TaxID=2678566 RepID=A0A6N8FKU9_9BACI|nr:SpoIID/LytB domain-containing protein [Ornithinibacillus caprae]